jgi:hypothetical protein
VDNGNTFIQSPAFNGTGQGRLLARFARWFHRTGVATLNWGYGLGRVSADNGATWTDFERWESNLSKWTRREVDLSSLVTPSGQMRLRFEAVEGRRQSGYPLVELLVDDVQVVRLTSQCAAWSSSDIFPPGPVGDTLRVALEGGDVVLSWSMPPEDATHGAARFFPLHRSASPDSGFAQAAEPCNARWHDFGAATPYAGSHFYLVGARNAAGNSGEVP